MFKYKLKEYSTWEIKESYIYCIAAKYLLMNVPIKLAVIMFKIAP